MREGYNERPIVCGTDFSAMTREAVDVAAGIARRLETGLVLIHVAEYSGMAAVEPGLFEEARAQKQADCEKEAARLRNLGTEVEIKLLSGSAFDELVTAAVTCKGRFVVVGATGHGLARRLLVGSVAERTAETSPIPTLVLRPGSRFEGWLRGEYPLKILVGYDFSPASDVALRWVNELQGIAPCETTVLHINWPPDEANRLGYQGSLPLNKNPSEIQDLLQRDLAEHVALRLPPENVTVAVEPSWGHPEAHLFERIEREKIDLVVVGTHRRHGWDRLQFGSVSRSILHHAQASVAVVPPGEEHLSRSLPQIERVLVATDFSGLGNCAVPYACAILRTGGTLKIVHVMEPAGAGRNVPPADMDKTKLHTELRALVPPDARSRFRIEPEVVEGTDAADVIRQSAERFGADVICLGSHGRSGLSKAFLGSIAQAVMTNSRRPVLIVREETR